MKRIILAALLLTGACKKDNDNPQTEAVVEAYLLPRQPVSVRISQKTSKGSTDNLVAVKGLSPVLVQNQTEYPLKDMGKGVYANPNISLQEKDSVHLRFEYKGKAVSAHTAVPDQPTGFTSNTGNLKIVNLNNGVYDPQMLEFKWNNPGNDLHMVVIQREGFQPWWIEPVKLNLPFTGSFNTKPTNATTELLRPISVIWYPEKYKVLLYRIPSGYAGIFKENFNGSLDITNPPANMTNGYGAFLGMSISDTLMLNVTQ